MLSYFFITELCEVAVWKLWQRVPSCFVALHICFSSTVAPDLVMSLHFLWEGSSGREQEPLLKALQIDWLMESLGLLLLKEEFGLNLFGWYFAFAAASLSLFLSFSSVSSIIAFLNKFFTSRALIIVLYFCSIVSSEWSSWPVLNLLPFSSKMTSVKRSISLAWALSE